MYQRKSNLQNLIIMLSDCLSITFSLILADYMRNGRLFYSDNERMDFGMLLAFCLSDGFSDSLYKSLSGNVPARTVP